MAQQFSKLLGRLDAELDALKAAAHHLSAFSSGRSELHKIRLKFSYFWSGL
jgi:hypothetical protein